MNNTSQYESGLMVRFPTAIALALLMTSTVFGQGTFGVSPDGTVGARCVLNYLVEFQATRDLCEIGTSEWNEAVDQAVVATSDRLVELGFNGFSAEEIEQYRVRASMSAKQSVQGFGSVAAFCSNMESAPLAFPVAELRNYSNILESSGADLIATKGCGQR